MGGCKKKKNSRREGNKTELNNEKDGGIRRLRGRSRREQEESSVVVRDKD